MSNKQLRLSLKESILAIEKMASEISGTPVEGLCMRGVRASIRIAVLDIRKAAARLGEAIEFATDSRKANDEFRGMESRVERDRSG